MTHLFPLKANCSLHPQGWGGTRGNLNRGIPLFTALGFSYLKAQYGFIMLPAYFHFHESSPWLCAVGGNVVLQVAVNCIKSAVTDFTMVGFVDVDISS